MVSLLVHTRKAQISLSEVHFPPMTESQFNTMHHCVQVLRWSSVCTVWHLWHSLPSSPLIILIIERQTDGKKIKPSPAFEPGMGPLWRQMFPRSSDIPVEPIRRSEILYDRSIWRRKWQLIVLGLNCFSAWGMLTKTSCFTVYCVMVRLQLSGFQCIHNHADTKVGGFLSDFKYVYWHLERYLSFAITQGQWKQDKHWKVHMVEHYHWIEWINRVMISVTRHTDFKESYFLRCILFQHVFLAQFTIQVMNGLMIPRGSIPSSCPNL